MNTKTGYRTIPLSRGLVALVDAEDYPKLAACKWHACKGYAVRTIPHPTKPGKRTALFMSRQLLGLQFGDVREAEHANLNTLDNTRGNLRIATGSQNCCNKRNRRTSRSGFKGVSFHKQTGTWAARITIMGKTFSLGLWGSPRRRARSIQGGSGRASRGVCQLRITTGF